MQRIIRETPQASRYPITGTPVSEREYVSIDGRTIIETTLSSGIKVWRETA